MEGKRKIIVTGASGFIGKSFLRNVDFNRFEVSVLTRDISKTFENQDKIKVVKGDLIDAQSLVAAFQNHEILVNLAAEVRNIELLEKTNVQGTKNLLVAIQTTGIEHVIHLSSVGVLGVGYQSNPTLVDENFPSHPDNEYERTKKISEDLFLEAAQKGSFGLTILRPTNVFGPNHPFDALLNILQHAQANKLLLHAPGAKVNYLYVDDLTQSILYFLDKKEIAEVYHVGSSMDLKLFYQLIKSSLSSQSKITSVPTILVKLASMIGINRLEAISNRTAYSDEKLKSFFTYSKGTEKGIEETIAHYKQRKLLK